MFRKRLNDERFEIIESALKGTLATYVIKDKVTGVQYLYVRGSTGGGLTPLLDSTGNVIVENNKSDNK